MRGLVFACIILWGTAAVADTERDRASAGGYFRVMTRPDFQGGDSRLGAWNLYGRLLNEGPWAALELRLDLLQAEPGSTEVWSSVHAKIEGGSFATVDAGGGNLNNFTVKQLYVQAGNLLLPHVTWRLGTQHYYFGDLGLYDLRPAALFADPSGLTGDTVGLSALYDSERLELLVGLGDAGYFLRGRQYNTVFTAGTSLRVRLGDHLEVGGGGQGYYEPRVRGNRFAPHQTPDIPYEDYYRGEAVQNWLSTHPGQQDFFVRPAPSDASSYKLIAYLGFGKLGPLRWNNLFAHYLKRHPDNFTTETVNGRDYTLFIKSFTDQRSELVVGDEAQITLIPERLDAALAMLYGRDENRDNRIAAGDDNRDYASVVLRLQLYLSENTHLLFESSLARELSRLGKHWREHYDSVFQNDGVIADVRGLQYGDTDERITAQFKGGVVLNPLGPGIYTRPSLRLLYGLQYSNVHNAFGNNFAETLDQYNQFAEAVDRHWHSMVAIEAEGWF